MDDKRMTQIGYKWFYNENVIANNVLKCWGIGMYMDRLPRRVGESFPCIPMVSKGCWQEIDLWFLSYDHLMVDLDIIIVICVGLYAKKKMLTP